MEILYVLIPLSVVLLAAAIGVFMWAVNSGQFEDLDTPAWRILKEDKPAAMSKTRSGERGA